MRSLMGELEMGGAGFGPAQLDALRAGEVRFRAMFEHAPVGIALVDLETPRATPNARLCAMLGYTAEEFEDLESVRVTHPDDLRAGLAQARRLLAGEGDAYAIEKRYLRKDGSTLWGRLTVSPVPQEPGGTAFLVAIVEDVTERRHAEQARAESVELFRTAFHTSPDAVSISRLDGTYLAVNDGFTRITGWTEKEILGRSSVDLETWARPGDRARLVEGLRSRGVVENMEAELRRRDGAVVTVLVSARLITVGGVQGLLAVTRDVTEWKRAKLDRERLEEQLLHSQKMEAMGRLAGGVAHDFNNILTTILTCASFLQETLGPDHEGRPDADQIVAAGERATALTRRLLALARRQRLAPRPLTLADAVRDMEPMLRRTLGDGVKLEVDLRAPATVEADPAQLEMVVLNLAVNSRDAMPDGGVLTLMVDELGHGAVAHTAEAGLPEGQLALLSVRDTGHGMSQETRARIFEPFFTTKEAGHGTGLGLSMVYGFVTQSGGAIRVRTAPGAGTEMLLYFPLLERAPARAAAPKAPARLGGSETLLLVEDEALVRGLARRLLAAAAYTVLEASSPSEALKLARQPFQLLLTDVLLPEMNGWELSRSILLLRPAARVLFMSGYAGDRLDGRPIVPADAPLLQKPFSPDQLLAKIRAVLSAPN